MIHLLVQFAQFVFYVGEMALIEIKHTDIALQNYIIDGDIQVG